MTAQIVLNTGYCGAHKGLVLVSRLIQDYLFNQFYAKPDLAHGWKPSSTLGAERPKKHTGWEAKNLEPLWHSRSRNVLYQTHFKGGPCQMWPRFFAAPGRSFFSRKEC